MSIREHRQERPKVRKGTSDLTRMSQRHRDRTRTQRSSERSTLQRDIDDWADEMENGDMWR